MGSNNAGGGLWAKGSSPCSRRQELSRVKSKGHRGEGSQRGYNGLARILVQAVGL